MSVFAVRWLVVAFCLAEIAPGQTPVALPQAAIHGIVTDKTRSPVAGAGVTVIGRLGSAMITDDAGAFALMVEPGTYQLEITKKQFVPRVMAVRVDAGVATPIVEVQLELAPVQTTMHVGDSPYLTATVSSATRTGTALRDLPQSISVIQREQVRDQMLLSVGDAVRYIPGITAVQGENNRDQLVIRGANTSADFFLNGVRDDVQYFRDFYNLERLEVLKGPNALVFGRGGGGGVVNRVTKEAVFSPLREIAVSGGAFGDRRVTADIDQPFGEKVAFRMNGMYEKSDSFRDRVEFERYGLNPLLTFAPLASTKIVIGYENFRDTRVADRGVPSFQGRPLDIGISTFFGNPDLSNVRALVNLGSAAVEHSIGRTTIRNRTLIGDYDRGYQNFLPGAVSADRLLAALTAYNNATNRRNVFNQTDVTRSFSTGRLRHTIVVGGEAGLQSTDNLRQTGFFNNTAASILIPLSNPTVFTPTTFRPNATDPNNHIRTAVQSLFVQDQLVISRFLQLIVGLRVDRFDLGYTDLRSTTRLRRVDRLVSPRAGLVLKPIAALSIYGSYGVSYLPSSGDQFSSLTAITVQVRPEKFSNYEAGIKWDVRRNLALTAAVFRQERTNTRATDPNDPTRIVQTGSQRTNGFEAGVTGSITNRWKIAGGYSYQDAFVTSATTAARAGAQVGQVPHHNFSVWNNYQVLRRLGAGLGIVNRANMFAAIDNTVVLPGYTRTDAAMFYSVTERIRFQVNAENLFDRRYYVNADNNTNISPGSSRSVRAGLIVRF